MGGLCTRKKENVHKDLEKEEVEEEKNHDAA